MYHGEVVPGFPQHPHRGFETVTIVRRGLIDHSDSLGATARFGRRRRAVAHRGRRHRALRDVPARSTRTRPNPLELFQIWLNLPRADKMVDAALRDALERRHPAPRRARRARARDRGHGRRRRARRRGARRRRRRTRGPRAPTPTSRSGPSRWRPARRWTLPRGARRQRTARSTSSAASGCASAARDVAVRTRIAAARRRRRSPLESGADESELLLLQGRPIGEPVVAARPVRDEHARGDRAGVRRLPAHAASAAGPGRATIRSTRASEGRFARHADGRIERPD